MILSKKKSGRFTYLYALKGYRDDNGKSTTKVVRKFGTVEGLRETLGGEDPIEWAQEQVRQMTLEEKQSKEEVTFTLKPSAILQKDEQRCFNGGYLFLQKVYYDLGLDKICKKIAMTSKADYDLNDILSNLLYTRILYPGSKLASLQEASRFIEGPKSRLHQVYRAMSLLAQNCDYIQSAVYKNSLALGGRNDKVLYYDCTNYYFESEQEYGLRQYGHSKESRPNPIVQMGLFMDMDGMPLAFCINPGNTSEQTTLRPLEQMLGDDFGLSRLVVCTDGGLSSYENRKYNDAPGRSFITVQSLKKLKSFLQDWALDPTGWTYNGQLFDLNAIDPEEYYDVLFRKERWINENGLEQRLIVTFSFKYMSYLRAVRERQVQRAQRLVNLGASRVEKRGQNDPKRFIERTSCTPDGEIAQAASYSLNQEMIDQEARFDGFYAICTNLEDPAEHIIKMNSGRWQIENAFRIMKTDFEARPVFLQRDDRIKAHFLTCFLALLLYKYVEKKLNRYSNHFTTREIIDTLADMNFLSIAGEGYIPTYTKTDLTNALHGSFDFRTDRQIVSKMQMRKIITQTKQGCKKQAQTNAQMTK